MTHRTAAYVLAVLLLPRLATPAPVELAPGLYVSVAATFPVLPASTTGPVSVEVVVTNDATSTQTLRGLTGVGNSWGTLFHHPEFAPGNPYAWQGGFGLQPDLLHLVLAPGASARVLLGTLTSVSGAVAQGVYTADIRFGYRSCCEISTPLTVVVSDTTSCQSPSSGAFDNANGFPLVDLSVSNVRAANGRILAEVEAQNHLSTWLSVLSVTSPAGGIAMQSASLAGKWAGFGLVPPCHTSAPGNAIGSPLGCTDPGRIRWDVSLCDAGDFAFRMGATPFAAAVTVLDVISAHTLRSNPILMTALATDLSEVPSFAAIAACLSNPPNSPSAGATCVTNATAALAANASDLLQIAGIAHRYGIQASAGDVVSIIGAVPLAATRIGGSAYFYGLFLSAYASDPTSLALRIVTR